MVKFVRGGGMEIHKPKPWHGLREFLKEYLIIVAGVLTALAGEQAVEAIHWTHEAEKTTQALSDELAASAAQATERIALEDCLRERIGQLTAKLNNSDGEWVADPMLLGVARASAAIRPGMPFVYRAPNRGWADDAWQAARSTGMINHLERAQVASYGRAYGNVSELGSLQIEEARLAPKLAFLGYDQRLDNASRVNALTILGELDYVNSKMALSSRVLVSIAKAQHLNFDRKTLARTMQETFAAQRRLRGNCVGRMPLEF